MHDPRTIGEQILADAGLSLKAKENLDKRLEGLGLPPSLRIPARIQPGKELEIVLPRGTTPAPAAARFTGGAVSAVLLDPAGAAPNPRVVPSFDVEDSDSEALFEPSDMIAAQAVKGLGTTAAGGTEVRFNTKGLVHVGSGAIGAYWNRPLGANQGFRWSPLAPGLLIPYDPRQGLLIGSDSTGGITVAGVLVLSFYRLPPMKTRAERDLAKIEASRGAPGGEPGSPWAGAPGGSGGGGGGRSLDGPGRLGWTPTSFRAALGARLAASGSDTTAGAVISGLGGGTDVTLGSFSDAGAGTQIYLAGSNMPVGGASKLGRVILNAPPANSDVVWVGETAALAVASNGGLNAAGQDTWEIPSGGKLFMLAASGTQILGARYRS